jgi:hypothetical protein
MKIEKKCAWVVLVGLVLSGCLGLKYEILKRTSVTNPPVERIKVYIKEFPVESRASVIEPLAAVAYQYYDGAESNLRSSASALAEIARSSRIEDLSAVLLRELRQDKIRTFLDVGKISSLDGTRLVDNPFELVPLDDAEAQLEIMGTAKIHSQRLGDQFSRNTSRVDIEVGVRDLKTDKVVIQPLFPAGINMVYNSRALEEAMAVTVATVLTRKTPF